MQDLIDESSLYRESDGDGDLTYLVKKYLPVSTGAPMFVMGNSFGTTNNYEEWNTFVNPLENPNGPPLPIDEQQYVDELGRKRTLEIPSPQDAYFPNEIHTANVFGLGDIFEHDIHLLGLGEITWNPYVFTPFPEFANITKVMNTLKTLPALFNRTATAIKSALTVDKFVAYSSALTFPETSLPVVSAISALNLDLSKVASTLTGYKNAITDSKFKDVLDNIEKWATSAKYIEDNMPSDSETAVTNMKRVIRITKEIPVYIKQTHSTLKLYFSLFKDGLTKLKEFGDTLYTILGSVPTLLNTKFTDVVAKINGGVKGIFDNMKTGLSKYTDGIKTYITNSVAKAQEYIGRIGEAVKSWTEKIMTAIQQDMNDMIIWIRDRVTDLTKAIVTDMTGIKDWIMKNILSLGDNIKNNVMAIGTQISNEAKAKIAAFQDQLIKTKNDIQAQFSSTIAATQADLKKYVSDIQGQFKGQLDSLNANITAKYKGLEDGITKATSQVTEITDKVKNLNELLNNLKAQYDTRITALESKIGFPTTSSSSSEPAKKGGLFSSFFSSG